VIRAARPLLGMIAGVTLLAAVVAAPGRALGQSAPAVGTTGAPKTAFYFAAREAQRYTERAREIAEQHRGAFVEQRRLLAAQATAEQQKVAADAQVAALTAEIPLIEAVLAQTAATQAGAAALAATPNAPESFKLAAASAAQLQVDMAKLVEQRKTQLAAATQAQAAATQQIAALAPTLKAATDNRVAAEKIVTEAATIAKAAVDRIATLDLKGDVPDPKQARQTQKLTHPRGLLNCRFDAEGQWLWAGGEDNAIHRFDWITGAKETFAGHKSWVGALAFLGETTPFVSGGYEGQLLFWDTLAGKGAPTRTIDAHKGFLRAMAVSPDGQFLVTCGNDQLVKVWKTADATPVITLEGHSSHVYSVGFSPDGKRLVSGDLKGIVKDWDVSTWKLVRDIDAKVMWKFDEGFKADVGGVRCLDFSPDGKLLALGGMGEVSNAFAGVGKPIVVIVDWESGKQLRVLESAEAVQGSVYGLKFSRAGDFLIGAGGGSGGALWFWNPAEVKSFHMVKIDQVARDLAVHPDGLRLAVPCFDQSLRVFDLTPAP
jgi:hypothetical protein